MSSGVTDSFADAGAEVVVVGTGEQSPHQRMYHEPGDTGLEAACGRLQLDGQRLPRDLAEQRRLDPCPDCFDGS